MKIGHQSYCFALVGVVSIASLIGYASELYAEEKGVILGEEEQLKIVDWTISPHKYRPKLDDLSQVESINPARFPNTLSDDLGTLTLIISEQEWLMPPIELEDEHDAYLSIKATTSELSTELLASDPIDQSQLVGKDSKIFTSVNHASNGFYKNDLPFSALQSQASKLGSGFEISGRLEQTQSTIDKKDWPSPVEDSQTYWFVLFDQFEYRSSNGGAFNWEGLGWIGGDYNRLWLKTRGDARFRDGSGSAELQVLYGRLISSFFDFQVGVRYDQLFGSNSNRGRAFGVIGIQGIAPYLFDVDAALFISEDGDVSARFSTLYNWRLTQRLVLQPTFEVNVAAQQVRDFGIGSGLNDIDLGLRLRYEITRGFAPYIGVSWTRLLGRTADFARQGGENVDNLTFVTGVRFLF